jgi:hypothetical protein
LIGWSTLIDGLTISNNLSTFRCRSWSRFYETVSAEIFGWNLIWSYLGLQWHKYDLMYLYEFQIPENTRLLAIFLILIYICY